MLGARPVLRLLDEEFVHELSGFFGDGFGHVVMEGQILLTYVLKKYFISLFTRHVLVLNGLEGELTRQEHVKEDSHGPDVSGWARVSMILYVPILLIIDNLWCHVSWRTAKDLHLFIVGNGTS